MRKILAAVVLLMAVLGVLSGCSNTQRKEEIEKAKYHLYYINSDETELVQDIYEPTSEEPQDMLTELMQFLREDTSENANIPLLPKGVEVNTYSINENTLTLDFNEAYNEIGATREILTRAGVVKLLSQVPDIDYVKFSAEGKELTDSQGVPLSVMNSDTFVEYSGNDINSYQEATISLYFTNQEGNRLIPEERTVYYNSNIPLERVVVEQLIKGPSEPGLYPTLPGTVTILGVTTEDGNSYLNFDSKFLSDALAVNEEVIIYSLVNSISEACQLHNVQVSVDGVSNVNLRETLSLNQFFKQNDELIDKEE